MSSLPRSNSVSSSVPSTAGTTMENDKKRRGNINDKIQQLLSMIPPEYFQDYYRRSDSIDYENNQMTPGGSVLSSAGMSSKNKGTGTKDGKPNKGQILTQAVEYISKLQNQVDARNREEVELILRVKELSKKTGVAIDDINLENTSAEVALAKIGVGPLAGVPEGCYGSGNQKSSSADYERCEE
ncbi:LAQU0S03e07030g1_1 [Lachancea quebecensis]|uniref:LAQU0S03e07030g1_1 n=1 Tax=Lachancea quebecensis TaxID=1654605 RepID=A0A0P1KPB5_9SACH|nr:LAQU0S03e07030g1_1 [Lachancea quebecensis]